MHLRGRRLRTSGMGTGISWKPRPRLSHFEGKLDRRAHSLSNARGESVEVGARVRRGYPEEVVKAGIPHLTVFPFLNQFSDGGESAPSLFSLAVVILLGSLHCR